MVVGIVAKNGILLLDADQKFRLLGLSAENAMLQASRRRLRPIVMTALATVAGMLPLAFALGAGSQMLQPLAIAVIGGILISMALSLIITPAVYFYLGRRETKIEAALSDSAQAAKRRKAATAMKVHNFAHYPLEENRAFSSRSALWDL